jgi:hypothetical protein
VIALWGATTPKLDVEPYYGTGYPSGGKGMYENIVLNLSCQPCSRYGQDKCPLEHFNCMEKQDIDHIISRIYARLRQPAR